MTRFAGKTVSALVAMLAALALAGCGGGEDSPTTDSAGRGDTAQQRSDAGKGTGTTPQSGGEKHGGSGNGKSKSAPPISSGATPTDAGPLPNEGDKAVAPGVPTSKGGDNSIQAFGVEAPSEDRVEASRVFATYLNARAAGDWDGACAYLSGSMRTQLAQLGGQARGNDGSDCPAGMRALTEGVPEETLRTAARIRVLSMRVDGTQAFLIYRDGEGTPSAVPMSRTGGSWRVAAIAGSALFLGA